MISRRPTPASTIDSQLRVGSTQTSELLARGRHPVADLYKCTRYSAALGREWYAEAVPELGRPRGAGVAGSGNDRRQGARAKDIRRVSAAAFTWFPNCWLSRGWTESGLTPFRYDRIGNSDAHLAHTNGAVSQDVCAATISRPTRRQSHCMRYTRICRPYPYHRAVSEISEDSEPLSSKSRRGGHLSDQRERCPNCARLPGSRLEAIALAQELAILWLVAEPPAAVRTRRFCRACAPAASPGDVACAVCADGPVLAMDVTTHASENAVITWLNTQGWGRSANQRGDSILLCPRCAQFATWPRTSRGDSEVG